MRICLEIVSGCIKIVSSHFPPADRFLPLLGRLVSCFFLFVCVGMSMFAQRRSRAILARARTVPRNADQVASEAFLGGRRGAQQYRGVAKASGPLRYFVLCVCVGGGLPYRMCPLFVRGRYSKPGIIPLNAKTSGPVRTSALVMMNLLGNEYHAVEGLGCRKLVISVYGSTARVPDGGSSRHFAPSGCCSVIQLAHA